MASPPVEVKKAISAKQLAPEPWQSLRGEMDRLFERFSRSFGLPSLRRTFDVEPSSVYESSFNFPTTAVDICEDDKTYKLTAEMPGLEAKHIDVSVTDSTLTIKGEKHREKEQMDKNYFMSERSYGSFQRSFALPVNIDASKIEADLSKGVLTVILPKTTEAQKQAKKIEVKAA